MPAAPGPAHTGPPHTRPLLLGLVGLGGAAGSLLRYAVSTAFDGGRAGTLAVNLAGSFLLGLLLARPGLGDRARLGLGAGVLGAFTTYSALAVEDALLLRDGRLGPALGYGVVSVLGGLAAAWAGIVAAGR